MQKFHASEKQGDPDCDEGESYSEELFQTVLYAPLVDGEKRSSNLVDGFGQAVDVVAVACRGQ